MGRGPAFNRSGVGSNPAATTDGAARAASETGLEVFVGSMPDSYSERREFDSLQAHHSDFCRNRCVLIHLASDSPS